MEKILDDISDFDEESKRILRGKRFIQFAALEKGIYGSGKDPFAGIRTNKTFDEISSEYALSTPFGKNSAFYKPAAEDYDALSQDFYTGGINYELLAKDLKEKLGLINNFLFEPEKYLLEDKTIYSGSSSFSTPVFSSVKNNKPFLYKKKDTEGQAIFDVAKLNTRKNLLSNSYNFGIYFDNYKVTYNLNFIYKDGEDKKFSDTETNATENPYDFKLNDEYIAIKLYTGNAKTFIEFLRIIKGNSQAEQMKKDIIRYYKNFFVTAENNPDIIDALYENIPDFVLETLTDEMLWNDFVSLSEKAIDTSGTNENLSVINLLKGVKNGVWWSTQVNNNPDLVRRVLNKLKAKYLEDFIIKLTKVGINAWKDSDYQTAISYSLEMKSTLKNGVVENRIVYWSGFLEKEKRFEVGFTIHSYENGNQAPSESGSETLGINDAFTPLRIPDDKEDYFIPTIVANYFTEKQLDEDQWTVFENIMAGLLPEFEASAFRSFSSLASKLRYSKYLKVLGENPAFQKILVELSNTRYMAKYLSLEEEAVLRFYTTNVGYKNFNKALRGEIAMTEEFKMQKELMNKALNKLPKYQSNELLYRIETLSEEQITKIYKVGSTIENKQFTSATYSEAAVERGIEFRGANLLIRIQGKNGKLIEDLSTLKIEKEVLFKSNTKFLVKEIGFAPNPFEPWVPIKRIILVEK